MDTTRWTLVAAISVSLVAVAIFWATLPEAGPPTPTAPPPAPVVAARAPAPAPPIQPSPRPTPRADAGRRGKAKGARRGARGGAQGEARARRDEVREAVRDGEGIPADVLETIEEHRAERVAVSAEKLATYAELAQWDAQTTENVQSLIATAHDDVDALIADASAGEVPWVEVRGEVRRIRADQARAVRDELGEEEFRRFARAMGRARGPRRGARR